MIDQSTTHDPRSVAQGSAAGRTPNITPPEAIDYQSHFQLHLESLRPNHDPSSVHPRCYASEAGGCDRRLHYRLSDEFLDGRPSSGDDGVTPATAILRHVGNNLHDEFQSMMKLLHPSFEAEVWWAHKGHLPTVVDPSTGGLEERTIISGRCDGLFTDARGSRVAVEIKSMTRSKLVAAQKMGTPYPWHAMQGALSCRFLMADELMVVYLSREWMLDGQDSVVWWRYPAPAGVAAAEAKRMQSLYLGALATPGRVPPRVIRGEPITDPERDKQCGWCPFLDRCALQGP